HKRKGVYSNGDFSNPHAGLFVNEDIDMRVFLSAWDKAYAVSEESEHGTRNSLQFFGKDGDAIHKIYLTKDSNTEAYKALVKKYKSEDQSTTETAVPYPLNLDEKPDAEV